MASEKILWNKSQPVILTAMNLFQEEFSLGPFRRGFHLVTGEIEKKLKHLGQIDKGQCTLFIKHTSASLTLNENADPTVRADFESHFNHMVPENAPYYKHTYEGPDDMPAHLKASILGSSLTLPISKGRFNLGTWQGIYLCEHRDHGGARRLVANLLGA